MPTRKTPALHAALLFIALSACLAACKPSAKTGSGSSEAFPKKWEYTLGARSDGALALAEDGTLVAACQDGYVYALDPKGSLLWKTYIGPTAASPLIGPDGAIYIANNNGSVYALNPSGSKRWQSVVYSGNTYGHNAGAIGNALLFTPSRNGLKAVSLSDGRVEWSTALGTEQWGAVTLLADGTILFGGHGRLNAVNTRGERVWEYPPLTPEAVERNGGFPPPGAFAVGSGIVPGPDRILFMGMGRNMFAAVGEDGQLRWKYESRGNNLNTASPVIASDGTIYFAHADGHLYAFDSLGGKKWDLDMAGAVAATPMLAGDGTIFALGSKYLYAVSPTGKVLARQEVGSTISSSPTLAPDGTVYVLNEWGIVSAYTGGHGGLMDSPWPKFQADTANSGNERVR